MLVDFYIGDEGIDKPGYATKVMLTWLVSSGQFCKDNRELKQRQRWQQQEWEKSNGFVKQDNNFAHASRFFVYFFAVTAWLPHETV